MPPSFGIRSLTTLVIGERLWNNAKSVFASLALDLIRAQKNYQNAKEEMTRTTEVYDQDIICVLGMHRSGTSLLARILNLLGVDLGPAEVLTTEPIAHNPKGYWEHHEITAISDAILKRYGGSWDEPPP